MKSIKIILTVIIFLFLANVSLASLALVSVQGTVRDAQTKALVTGKTIDINLYDINNNLISGKTMVPLTNGVFSYMLGTTTELNCGTNYKLKLSIDGVEVGTYQFLACGGKIKGGDIEGGIFEIPDPLTVNNLNVNNQATINRILFPAQTGTPTIATDTAGALEIVGGGTSPTVKVYNNLNVIGASSPSGYVIISDTNQPNDYVKVGMQEDTPDENQQPVSTVKYTLKVSNQCANSYGGCSALSGVEHTPPTNPTLGVAGVRGIYGLGNVDEQGGTVGLLGYAIVENNPQTEVTTIEKGVWGLSQKGSSLTIKSIGVGGQGDDIGVEGISVAGNAIEGTSSTGYAGYFKGGQGVKVQGNLEVTGSCIGCGNSWIPLGPIDLGTLRFTAGTSEYSLPASIPANAKGILVYIWVAKGATGVDAGRTYTIYTKEGATIYTKKHAIYDYNNQAWVVNSDNLWLPVTSERKLYVNLNEDISGNSKGGIEIIGYGVGGTGEILQGGAGERVAWMTLEGCEDFPPQCPLSWTEYNRQTDIQRQLHGVSVNCGAGDKMVIVVCYQTY